MVLREFCSIEVAEEGSGCEEIASFHHGQVQVGRRERRQELHEDQKSISLTVSFSMQLGRILKEVTGCWWRVKQSTFIQAAPFSNRDGKIIRSDGYPIRNPKFWIYRTRNFGFGFGFGFIF